MSARVMVGRVLNSIDLGLAGSEPNKGFGRTGHTTYNIPYIQHTVDCNGGMPITWWYFPLTKHWQQWLKNYYCVQTPEAAADHRGGY